MLKRIAVVLCFLLIPCFFVLQANAAEIAVAVDGNYLDLPVAPLMVENRVLVPMRAIFEALGANVDWQGSSKTILATKNGSEVKLVVGSKTAYINGTSKTLDVPPRVSQGTTLIPLRFVGEALGEKVTWDEKNTQVIVGSIIPKAMFKQYSTKVGKFSVNVVEIPKGSLQAGIALGQGKVGGAEDMAAMAKRVEAKVAINGTFFEAYQGTPEPWGTLIKNGKVIHVGNLGTSLGITSNGNIKFAPLRISVKGGINGSYSWPNNWYAYGFNRTPSANGAFIFTPERGSKLGFASGISIVVRNGAVTQKVAGQDVTIPQDGYVINFAGEEKYLADRFNIGDTVSYQVEFSGGDFAGVETGLGAGPRLVKSGTAVFDPKTEGFTSTKILESSGARSAIGVKKDGTIVLVTTVATVKDLSGIMKELGCVDAMNLDGGASSGLYVNGRYITKPGRKLSNILYFK